MLSRFHYIKMHFPESYRNLITAGINEDYSMGYPEEPGFRAGIARPFYFYDIVEEKKCGLKITTFPGYGWNLLPVQRNDSGSFGRNHCRND